MPRQHNPERRGLTVGVILGALGLLLLLVPGTLGLDGFDGGFALSAFGVLFIIAGVITVAMYLPRVRRVNALFAAENLLAHWQYDTAQVARQVARDRTAERQHNRVLLLIVIGWLLFFTALFAVIGYLSGEGDNIPLFVAIMAGVGLIVAAAALLAPGMHARRALRSSGEAYIGREGLFLNGAYHTWVGRMARLEGLMLEEGEAGARLAFHLSVLTGPGFLHWNPYTLEVPIPAGERATAERVVAALTPLAH